MLSKLLVTFTIFRCWNIWLYAFLEYSNGFQEEHIAPAIAILHGKLGFYPLNYNVNESLRERINRIFGARPFEEDFPISEFDGLEKELSKY